MIKLSLFESNWCYSFYDFFKCFGQNSKKVGKFSLNFFLLFNLFTFQIIHQVQIELTKDQESF
jgi:hypothetical protein